MSSSGPGGREVAHRIFAAEFDDATASFTRGDEERSPKYVIAPSGELVNRVFLVGVLTAVERVNDETLRARVADPTGVFVVYASQYQPDARAALEDLSSPTFVAITGKANAFVPEGSDRALTSIRPEAVAEVDANTRDHWTVSTAEQTLARVGTFAAVRLGRMEASEAIERANDAYEPTDDYLLGLHEVCIEALELVAGERDGIDRRIDPAMSGGVSVSLEDVAAVGRELGESIPEAASAPPTEPPDDEPTEPEPTASDPPDPDEPVVTSDEREAIETEFGTEFATGDEVDPPEEPTTESDALPGDDEDTETEVDEDLSDQVMDVLVDLDEGEGIGRERIVDAAADRLDADREAIDEALRSAMMDGQCYEPAEDVLRPI